MTGSPAPVARAGIVGLGYMGLATGLAFSTRGAQVYGFDINPETLDAVARGSCPYKEKALPSLLRSQVRSGRFRAVKSLDELVVKSHGIFLCVPTPSRRDGHIDLRPLKRCSRDVGRALKVVSGFRVIVVKSTVVPGTTEGIVGPLVHAASGRTPQEVSLASNPEFLAEGTMVHDALFPERVVIGTTDARALRWLRQIYRPFHAPVLNLTPSGAELVKYSANAFLALKVSFANEISRISDRLGVNVDSVLNAVGKDSRIGGRFLRAGPGFGGSCFEKDIRALVARADELKVKFRSGETALLINQEQERYVVDLIRTALGHIKGSTIALLGLAFKAGTDDVRESRALILARDLLDRGAAVRCHDPAARQNFRRLWVSRYSSLDPSLAICETVERTIENADAVIVQADWPVYVRWHREWTRRLKQPLLIDLRRAINPRAPGCAGLVVIGLGSGNIPGRRRSIAGGGSN